MKTITEEGEPLPDSQQTAADGASNAPDGEQALQIKTILVPLDFSGASMPALKYSISLAEKFKAAIHLVHVQPADELTALSRAGNLMLNYADAIALMQDRLAEVQRKHDVLFWPDNCHVVSGRPFEEICKLARDISADLIVLPTRGHSGLKHVVLGSTAERVVRYALCPVLVLRGARYLVAGTQHFPLRKILVPVDFSQCSIAGVKYGASLARSTGASLRLLHVVFPYAQIFGVDRVGADATSVIENARAAAGEEMGKLTQMDFLRGVSFETEIRTGPAIDEICSESGRPDIDLVVTSTHGRTGFQRAFLGSVAEHVVRYAESPVITVPSRGRS